MIINTFMERRAAQIREQRLETVDPIGAFSILQYADGQKYMVSTVEYNDERWTRVQNIDGDILCHHSGEVDSYEAIRMYYGG